MRRQKMEWIIIRASCVALGLPNQKGLDISNGLLLDAQPIVGRVHTVGVLECTNLSYGANQEAGKICAGQCGMDNH